MPTAWRIVKTSRVAAAFDGEGARLYGGRWNSPGTAMVYTSESVALAALELLVHLQSSPLLARYSVIPARFDEDLVEPVDPASLPRGWNAHPAPVRLQEIGDRWVAQGRSAVLRVPSAVVPTERNFLLNPAHTGFAKVEIGAPIAFAFDPRFKQR
jgi:RES domain-containing protein